jgi:thiamine pyrophosphokinase
MSMRTIIFAGGTLRPGAAVDKAIASAEQVIAADSGAETAMHYGLIPHFIVGDLDSLLLPLEDFRERGCEIIQAAVEKNETDTELAIEVAIEHGASDITILGGLGGERFEHTIANILLLADIESLPIRIIDGPSICWLLRGPGSTTINGQNGDLLSLLPLTAEASGVRTTNLYYPLYSETLRFGRPRGISNVLTQSQAEVSLAQGMLLVIHTATHELQKS